MASIAIAGPSYAATIHVPEDHATIQGAIDAAADGDTIIVRPGTYHEALRIEKPITLQASSIVSSDTVIDATGSSPVITLSTGNSPATVTIQGFTIRNNTPVPTATLSIGGITGTASSLDLFRNDFTGSTGDTSIQLSISTSLHMIENNFSTDLTGSTTECETLHPQVTFLGSTDSTYFLLDRNKFTGGNTLCQNQGIDLIHGTYSIQANRFTKVDSPVYIARAYGLFWGNVVERFTGLIHFWTDPASNLSQGTVGPPSIFIVNNSFDQATPSNSSSPYLFQGALAKFAVTNNVFSASSARALIDCTDDTTAPAKTPVVWFHNLVFNRDTGLLAIGSCSFPRAGEEGNLTQDPRYVGTGADPLRPLSIRLALFVLPCAFFGFRKRRAIRGLLIAVFAIAVAASLSGCSGMYPGYTPPGTYTIQFNGSGGGITHSASTTLTVTR